MHHKEKQISKRRVRLVISLGLSLLLALMVSSASESQSPEPGLRPAGTPSGQTATLLPDGRSLMIGGEGPTGPLASASLWDSRTKSSVSIEDRLLYPRAFHTATLLPDGTVLVLGGVDSQNLVVDRAELFSMERGRFQTLPPTGLTPRAYHTATVLTDGRMLVAGGITTGARLAPLAELWDPSSNSAEILPSSLIIPRQRHTATFLPNGHVLLWGGVDQNGQRLNNGEDYDPITKNFVLVETPYLQPSSSDTQAPSIVESLPHDDAADVDPKAIISLRFSEPMHVETVNATSVVLAGTDGIVTTQVIPTENGMLAFIIPKRPLVLGTTYTVTISGPTDLAGLEMPRTTIQFTVGDVLSSFTEDDEEWKPTNLQNWRRGDRESSWRSLPSLQAAPGVTALSGQVLTLNRRPLANVTLQIDDKLVQTDSSGRFLLANISSGQKVLVIDGKTANRGVKIYGLFEAGVNITSGKTNVLPYTIWMPVIDTVHAVTIPSPTTSEVMVTTPLIPGLKLFIPPKTIIRDRNGQVVRTISITPIPIDRPPFPLPMTGEFPIFFTIQPWGAHVETLDADIPHGIRVVYPNYQNFPSGMSVDFWNYEPDGIGWFQYGKGKTSSDGVDVVPDMGVAIHKFTASSFVPVFGGGTPPPNGPEAGDDDSDGDPVDLSTGLFVLNKTDLFLPDVFPISLTRTYRQNDTISRPFGIGATHPYELFLAPSGGHYLAVELILPDGGRIYYNRISPGVGYVDGVFEHALTPSEYYKSQIKWNGNGWDLTLKNGTVYVFGKNAPLQYIRDRHGNRITITRTNAQTGNITKITSTNGRSVDFTYDASNRIIEAKDNIGRTVLYTYDTEGRLATVTDPNNGVTEYTYDSNHRMLTIEDARGIVFLTNEYDANGRVINQTQADNTTYQFAYTLASGKVIQTDVTNPRGHIRRVTFDSSSYTLTDTHALGQPEQQTITYERQAGTNLVLSITDSLNRKTSFTYDSFGNRTSVTRLFGTSEAVTTTFTYEPQFNQLASVTDPLNHTTSFSYDTLGNLISITDPLTHQTTLTYHPDGKPSSIKNHLNHTTEFNYELGDLTSVTDPLGNTTTRFYDNVGRLLNLTNPLGHMTAYEYDPLNRVTRVVDALGGATAFSYDPNGNLLSVTDARNNATTYIYNTMDRLESRTDPLLLAESYLYDNNGNLATFTDRKTQTTGFTYDALNRRMGVTYADASTVTYTYDAGNRVTQIVDSLSGTITRTYDNLDRLTSETTPQGTVSYTYDAANRRSTMTVAGQPTVNYTYDEANRLTQITQGSSTVSFGYDAANRRKSTTLPNGIVVEYIYDSASRVTAIDYKQGTTVLGNLTYQYDANGNRTQIGGSWARTGLPQALSSAIYNAANQMTAFGDQMLTYDANGNLTGDGVSNYVWDPRNRLTSIDSPATNANFQYDPLKRRINKSINGTSISFLYDGQTPIQELEGSTPTANLLTGLGFDEYFTRTGSTGTNNLLMDALGSTIALANDSSVVQTEYTYEPFGKTTISGQSNSNPFQYTGRENDQDGFYYYRARYYSPQFDRFVSPDPLLCGLSNTVPLKSIMKNPQTNNSFAYVNNSPINLRDPLGLTPECQYYDQRCSEVTGEFAIYYFCDLAKGVCENTPRDTYFNCVRQCLQDFDKNICVKNYGRKDPTGNVTKYCSEIAGHTLCLPFCVGAVPGMGEGN